MITVQWKAMRALHPSVPTSTIHTLRERKEFGMFSNLLKNQVTVLLTPTARGDGLDKETTMRKRSDERGRFHREH